MGLIQPHHGGLAASAAPRAIALRHAAFKQEHLLTCEIAALRSALTARGIAVSEASLLAALPVDARPLRLSAGPFSDYTGGPDPYVAFAGSVDGHEYDGTGYGVYDPPVAAVARGTGAVVSGGEDIAPATLYDALFAHRPSVVWAQNPLRPVATTRHYTADDGRSIPYAYPEHAYALVGADLDAASVVLMNPFDGTDEVVPMADFEASYAVFGDMAVTVGGGDDAGVVPYPAATPPPQSSPPPGGTAAPGSPAPASPTPGAVAGLPVDAPPPAAPAAAPATGGDDLRLGLLAALLATAVAGVAFAARRLLRD